MGQLLTPPSNRTLARTSRRISQHQVSSLGEYRDLLLLVRENAGQRYHTRQNVSRAVLYLGGRCARADFFQVLLDLDMLGLARSRTSKTK